MNRSSWSRILAFWGALMSYAALAGGIVCLHWLAVRLEGIPEVWLSPWAGDRTTAPPLVIVDAGHGGHDGGAVANGLVEKDLTLKLANLLRHHLESAGLRVKMTRRTDVFLPLDARSGAANEEDAAAFVSLHLNTSVTAPEVTGLETYFTHRKALATRQVVQIKSPPQPLQDRLGEWLARCIQQSACRASKAADRGVKDKPYAVVTHTACPAVLVECGFLTNAAEAARLNQHEYRDQLARGIAHGVAEFLKTQAVRGQRATPPATPDPMPATMTAALEEP